MCVVAERGGGAGGGGVMVLPQQGHSLTPSLAASDTLVRLLLNVPAVQVRNLPPFGNRRSNLEPLPLMSALLLCR